MRSTAVITVACLLFAAANAFASDPRWEKISNSLISFSYLDVHSLTRTLEGNHQYTVKTVPVMAGAIDEEYERHDVGYVILHGEMNCFKDSFKESSVDIFSSSGALIATEQGQPVFKPVDPLTLEGSLHRFFCRRHD